MKQNDDKSKNLNEEVEQCWENNETQNNEYGPLQTRRSETKMMMFVLFHICLYKKYEAGEIVNNLQFSK